MSSKRCSEICIWLYHHQRYNRQRFTKIPRPVVPRKKPGYFLPHRPHCPHWRLAVSVHNLHKINGQLRQEGNTTDLIFSVAKLISTLSSGMTLLPGDIIATGTPEGVGMGFSPPKFLCPGDVVEITIDPIGTLRNPVK